MRQASEDDTQSQLAATQQQLSDEQQAHAAAAPSAAVLQVNLQEAQQAASAFLSQLKLVEEGLAAQKQCREDANQKAASLQTRLQEVKGELAAEQQACITARETLTSLQTERAAAQESAASLQAKLAAPEEALAAEKFAHGSAVTSLKADLGVAEQGVSCLQSQLKALESQLAAGKQALEAVIQSVARFPSPLKAVQQELADKTANWSGEKQGEQAGAEAVAGLGHHVAASGHQVEEAAQRCPSPQEGLRSSWSKTHESRDSQPDADVASQLTPRYEGVSIGTRGVQGAGQAWGSTAPLQQETPGSDPNTLLDLQKAQADLARIRQARQAGRADIVAPRKRQPSPALALCSAYQDEAALEEEVPRGQAKHGSPIAPVQQETPDRDTTTMKDEHGMEPELRALQQELQDTKAALHLSKDRLQEQDATIHYLRTDYEASWRKMSGRHEELLQQVKCLNASLRRAGAHDEDAYRHDIQDYKTSP
ncbi:TPA: hypothetical protein ACH3X1_014118 [Trebouxia sp. C0004]